MKQQIIPNALVLMSLFAFTGCPNPSDKSNQNVVVTPQGRISSQSAPGTYCDLNNGTIMCTSIDSSTGASCNSLAKSYIPSDMANFCQQVAQLRIDNANSYNRCNVDSALTQILSQNCNGVAGWQNVDPGNGNGNFPGSGSNPNFPGGIDQSMKSFQCDFEAQRISQGKILGLFKATKNEGIPRTWSLITLDGRLARTISLREKFLGWDAGKFGEISMRYRPATGPGTADTIILQNKGLRTPIGKIQMSRSGFAGGEVRLDAQTEDMYISVACRGDAQSQFKGDSSNTGHTLACTGKSSVVGGYDEGIDMELPLNGGSLNESLSKAVDVAVQGGVISLTAVLDQDYGPTLTSTSSLKSAAVLMGGNEDGNVNVSCKLKN